VLTHRASTRKPDSPQPGSEPTTRPVGCGVLREANVASMPYGAYVASSGLA
jgi:hypothetical protein